MMLLIFKDTVKTDYSHHHRATELADYPRCSVQYLSHTNIKENPPSPLRADCDIIVTHILCNFLDHSTVYGGYHCDALGQQLGVVIKISSEDMMRYEVAKYADMKDIQGEAIPRLYGVLCAKSKYGEDTSFMVMEKFGDYLQRDFLRLRKEEKAKILTKLVQIHRAGAVTFEDFEEVNVMQKDDDFRIVDFEPDQMLQHDGHCGWTYNFHSAGDYPPCFLDETAGTCCIWIYIVARNMGFWDEGQVSIGGSNFPKEGLPTQEQIDSIRPYIGPYSPPSPEDRAKLLYQFYAMIYEHLQEGAKIEDLREEEVMDAIMDEAKVKWGREVMHADIPWEMRRYKPPYVLLAKDFRTWKRPGDH